MRAGQDHTATRARSPSGSEEPYRGTGCPRWTGGPSVTPTPASSGPTKPAHRAREPHRKHRGPQHGSTCVHSAGPSPAPHGPFSRAERSPGMCMEQARPPGDRSAVALPTVRSQLLSKQGQTTTEDVFPEPAPVQWTHRLPTRMACSTASPSHTRGFPGARSTLPALPWPRVRSLKQS